MQLSPVISAHIGHFGGTCMGRCRNRVNSWFIVIMMNKYFTTFLFWRKISLRCLQCSSHFNGWLFYVGTLLNYDLLQYIGSGFTESGSRFCFIQIQFASASGYPEIEKYSNERMLGKFREQEDYWLLFGDHFGLTSSGSESWFQTPIRVRIFWLLNLGPKHRSEQSTPAFHTKQDSLPPAFRHL